MPAKSKAQQAAMGIAAGIKEGKVKGKKGSPSASIAKGMNLADIKDFASTPAKGLPAKAPKSVTRSAGGMPPGQPMAPTPTPEAPMGGPMKMNNLTGGIKKVR